MESAERIDVVRDSSQWTAVHEAIVRRAALAALDADSVSVQATLCVLLSDDAAIRILNQQFRGIDRPTNVLSFPASKTRGQVSLGDIAIAFETVAREAETECKIFGDHLAHLTVHGVLHLLGDDHETAAQAEAMEAREVMILAGLGIADPYRDTELVPDIASSYRSSTLTNPVPL